MDASKKPITPLTSEEIDELVPFFDLLARFDFEDKQREIGKDRATASP